MMTVSAEADLREFYNGSADTYAAIMDSEIESPLYADLLGRLAERIAGHSGAVVDTSCGPGHLLLQYHERFEPTRQLIGVDLSPRMVALASAKLGPAAPVSRGDMRNMSHIQSGGVVAVISLFALHQPPAAGAEWKGGSERPCTQRRL